MAVCGLLLMLCTPFVTAIPLSSFYPYGLAADDFLLPPYDDGFVMKSTLLKTAIARGGDYSNFPK